VERHCCSSEKAFSGLLAYGRFWFSECRSKRLAHRATGQERLLCYFLGHKKVNITLSERQPGVQAAPVGADGQGLRRQDRAVGENGQGEG